MQQQWFFFGVANLVLLSGASAQQIAYAPQGLEVAPRDHTFEFVGSVASFDNRVVKNAPYSAEAVTETVQVLQDGNRITRKNTATLHRDSQGRTRREEALNMIGPWAASGEAPVNISINDPSAGVSYSLSPREKTARKMVFSSTMPQRGGWFTAAAPAPASAGETRVIESRVENVRQVYTSRTEGGAAGVAAAGHAGAVGLATASIHVMAPGVAAAEPFFFRTNNQEGKTESLGARMMEGVEADGTRTTVTIPAGEIGNERPIDMVDERWFSKELQTVIMTKHSDPRMGETTYKLTRINRSEPTASLFEVPSDYTVMDQKIEALRESMHKTLEEQRRLNRGNEKK